MEQYRQLGEVLGSLKALMVLQYEILINQRQCCLLLDMFTLAFTIIADEIRQNLKLEEKNIKWKPLKEPLRELCMVFREGEHYVRRCMVHKDWWGKAISLHQNIDCVEFHIHNLLSVFPAVIEAIESAGEISGLDHEEMRKKRVMLAEKYDARWNDEKLFRWRFAKQYLIPSEMCTRMENAIREDKWVLSESIIEKKKSGSLTKNVQRLGDMLLKKLNDVIPVNGKLPPSSVLLGAEDYQVRRRLGFGSQYKEIQWLGENFTLRHVFGDIDPLNSEIFNLLSLSHPNILQYLCGFYDEERKECFLVMELMSKDLYTHVKENSSPRRHAFFPLHIVVDMLLQIARGIEFLHSQEVYVGDLNPTKIFIKPRKSTEGYFHVKISGFGLKSVAESYSTRHRVHQNQHSINPHIWYAPEVLAEEERLGNSMNTCKYTEKADVYSFGMICFLLLTGKLPFEDGHLPIRHNDMIKNIRAGERPLFPSVSPKNLANLTKNCWHSDPNHRPSFSSICRMLRYTKKFVFTNSYETQPHISLPVDCFELETSFLKKFGKETKATSDRHSVLQIPLQMFSYRLTENEKTSLSIKFDNVQSETEAASGVGPESISVIEDPMVPETDSKSVASDLKSVYSDIKSTFTRLPGKKILSDLRSVQSEPINDQLLIKKNTMHIKQMKNPVKLKPQTQGRPLPWSLPGKQNREMYKLGRPLPWSLPGNMKQNRETSKQFAMSPLSRENGE